MSGLDRQPPRLRGTAPRKRRLRGSGSSASSAACPPRAPVMSEASCDLAPTALLTAERENEPETGNDEQSEPARLAKPTAISSCPAGSS